MELLDSYIINLLSKNTEQHCIQAIEEAFKIIEDTFDCLIVHMHDTDTDSMLNIERIRQYIRGILSTIIALEITSRALLTLTKEKSVDKAKRNIKRLRNENFILCEKTDVVILFDKVRKELLMMGHDYRLGDNFGLREIINMIKNARAAGPTI